MQQADPQTSATTSSPSRHALTRPIGRVGVLWLSLALLLFLLGFGIARWQTPSSPSSESSEVTFARAMSVHHAQAVSMALIMDDRSTNQEIRTLARDITLTQQAQIGQMQGWLAVWSQPLSGPTAPMNGMDSMMGMASQQQINALQSLPVPQAEVAFLKLMIRHHQGGIMMAKEVLRTSQRPEVVRSATAIVNSQQSEIQAMQGLLNQRG